MAFLNFVSFFLCLSDAHIKIFAHTVVEEAFVFSAEDRSNHSVFSRAPISTTQQEKKVHFKLLVQSVHSQLKK